MYLVSNVYDNYNVTHQEVVSSLVYLPGTAAADETHRLGLPPREGLGLFNVDAE